MAGSRKETPIAAALSGLRGAGLIEECGFALQPTPSCHATFNYRRRWEPPRISALYSLDLEAGAVRHADPHHAGVVEHLVVVTGRLRAGPQDGPVLLAAGDLLRFSADVPHVYEALETTHCVLLMAYP